MHPRHPPERSPPHPRGAAAHSTGLRSAPGNQRGQNPGQRPLLRYLLTHASGGCPCPSAPWGEDGALEHRLLLVAAGVVWDRVFKGCVGPQTGVLQSVSISNVETPLFLLFSFSGQNQQPPPGAQQRPPCTGRRWELGFCSTPDCLSWCRCLFCLTMKLPDCP